MAPDAAHDEYLKAVALARARRWDEARARIEGAIAMGGARAEFVRLQRSLPMAGDLLAGSSGPRTNSRTFRYPTRYPTAR